MKVFVDVFDDEESGAYILSLTGTSDDTKKVKKESKYSFKRASFFTVYGTYGLGSLTNNNPIGVTSGSLTYGPPSSSVSTIGGGLGYRKAINDKLYINAKVGIEKYGKRAVAAVFKELKQLDEGAVPGKPAVRPIDPNTLTSDEKRKALSAVNLIKEKRDGKLKGRTCADGRK